jgi:tetratricopeptide (TPR) repeat protein
MNKSPRGSEQKSRPPDHYTFDNLRVEAFKHPLTPSFPGGPVLTDAAFARLRHKRGDQACDHFDEQATFNAYVNGEWVYIGPKHHHFGHIMAEMVHRILPSKVFFPDIRKYVIVTTFDDDDKTLCDSYREVLEFFEIDPGAVLVLNENKIVERLSICEQGANLEGHPMPWYLAALREFSTRRLDSIYGSRHHPEKVYVSKSKIPHGGTILGERYMEELLSREGFFVFYPEEAPLTAQMDVYRKAKVLVFSEGSAFHGTELLGEAMLDHTYLIVRRIYAREVFASILEPRSRHFEMFPDTFFLGTIVVDPETRDPHSEFGVSVLDIDRLIAFFRDRQIARLDDLDIREYFEAAEQDLRAYFQYHAHGGIAEADPWRVGEVRLEFERLRLRFLGGRVAVPLEPAHALLEDADTVARQAWAAHQGGKWLEAARRWEIFRERFPHAGEGFSLGSIALIELGRFYEADAVLRIAMERFPEAAEMHSNYALVAHRQRDWREALARWDAFCTRFPASAIGYSLGATALCELGRFAEAANLVRLGLECIPQDEELLEKQAWVAGLSQASPGS